MLKSGFFFRGGALLVLLSLALCPAGAAPPGEGAAPSEKAAPTPAPRPATVEAARIAITRGWFGRSLAITIGLTASVPFRIFTLTEPPRLVVDLEGIAPPAFGPLKIAPPRGVTRAWSAPAPPGSTRLVFELGRPFALEAAEMGPEGLRIALVRVDPDTFAARSGAPPGTALGGPPPGGTGAPLVVVLDPGHGGSDPGATREGVAEKDVALAFARELAAALTATGRFAVSLTRDTDTFLPLAARAEAARARGAGAFLSIHMNAVEDPAARGGIVFTLSEAGSSAQARARAAAENRADGAPGAPPVPPADPVRDILDDLGRSEAGARSVELARALAEALGSATEGGTQAPLQSANFEVLRGTDVPSALVELGFLSNDADRAHLTSPEWRSAAARALAGAMVAWAAAGGPLTRK